MGYLTSGAFVGHFRIDGLLGRGGMATVYLATHESTDRQVALKLLDPELAADPRFVARFRREGQSQASLEHPHVVTVYEAGEDEEGLFLAMQLVRGPTLAALIAGGALTGERALALLDQIADALDAAHAAGLVHRDVKPRNVLVGDGDHAYLADFGLTKLGEDTGLTMTGELLGTLAYLAPEVIRGGQATAASDRYALAALAFECLTGGVVFPRTTQAAQLFAHTSEPVPRISRRRPELPPAADQVFERALAKQPDERPRSARALVAAIREALGDSIATLAPPTPQQGLEAGEEASTATQATPTGTRSPRLRAIGIVPIVVAAIVGGGLAAGAVAVLGGDDDKPAAVRTVAAVAIPAPEKGTTVLGSDLRRPGRTLDCDGRPVRSASPRCTVLQTELPGATIVVPRNGVIRRWAVRGAVGEIQLQVIRPRDREYHQIAVSRSEFVADGQVHAFKTDIAVEAGDVLGLYLVSGSGVGMRPAARGATTARFMTGLRGIAQKPTHGPGSGLDGELLLRVEYTPGGTQTLPPQVTGAAAARLPPGKLVKRRRNTSTTGRQVEVRLVNLGDRFALDLFNRGRRLARLDIPDSPPSSGEVILFDTFTDDPKPPEVAILLDYQRIASARTESHYIVALPREFAFIN